MKTKKMLIPLFLVLLFCGCEQNESFRETKETFSRISFKNTQEFFDTFNKLSLKSYDEQIKWSRMHSSAPFLLHCDGCEDNEIFNMPTSFQALFDKHLEIQINDSILKYVNGEMILISDDEKIVCGNAIAISASSLEQSPTSRTTTNVTFGKLGANHQQECTPYNYGKYKFKYVHELKSVNIRINNQDAEALFITLKLEYKGRSWHEAGESRTINLNLSGYAKVGNYGGGNINVNSTINVAKNHDFLLLPAFIIPNGLPVRVWTVNITGTITHTMNGFPETKWVDTW
ncbi:hypothetical protein AB9N12_13400 [Bacteroides sp. AN502(2024)]|uniref:hypothetical protein n=1 Tax=Bacteroides sp. AN502(2024) TaxID=3160599 RepID=UPI003515E636